MNIQELEHHCAVHTRKGHPYDRAAYRRVLADLSSRPGVTEMRRKLIALVHDEQQVERHVLATNRLHLNGFAPAVASQAAVKIEVYTDLLTLLDHETPAEAGPREMALA